MVDTTEEERSLTRLSRKQWLTLLVFAIADFCSAICVSLQAPFYPKEAERKGATATEYGLVFGVFEFTVFLVSPILGKKLNGLGAKRVFNVGIFTTGTCSILFGLLDNVVDGKLFIGLSFVIRIVEAVGNSGFLTASFSIIAKEFPDRVATMFACLETFFGIGLIVGPTVGGALYQAGGYELPFIVLGSVLIAAALMTHCVLPDKYNEKDGDADRSDDKGLMDLLKVPSIALAAYSILCASVSIGYIQATLEPHLRQFDLQPVTMGAMFVVNGGVYACSAPLWGLLCDKKMPPIVVTSIGAFFVGLSFLFLGPAPFIPLDASFGLCIAMLVIHGVGFAAQLVAGFSSAHRAAITNGFPDNLNTYALVSGLWTATFALGAFIGPSVAGLLVDYYDFPVASLFVVATQISVLMLTSIFLLVKCYHQRKMIAERGFSRSDYQVLEGSSGEEGYSDEDGVASSTDGIVTSVRDVSPDSGSFTDYEAIDAVEKLEVSSGHYHRRRQRSRRSGFNVPRAQASDAIFSPSPLDPSPISLLGGYMGISVPTAMNDAFDDSFLPTRGQTWRQRSQSEKEPLLQHQAKVSSSDSCPRIVVTAMVEQLTPRMKHPSGSLA